MPPPPPTTRVIGGHTVYVRASWDAPWVAAPDLHCEEAVWTAAPSIPTATLRWVYGWLAPTGTHFFREVLKNGHAARLYVRILFRLYATQTTSREWTWKTRTWHGVIEVDEDLHHGDVTDPATLRTVATGEQFLTAYGMEHLLDRQTVHRSWFDTDDEGTIKTIDRGLTFNRDGKPNRAKNLSGPTYHFSNRHTTAEKWTTRQIIQYLLRYHAPKDAAEEIHVPFELNLSEMADAAADWDSPVLEADGRSVYSLLTSLLPRQRLVGFYCEVEEPAEVEDPEDFAGWKVHVRPFSFTPVSINTRGGARPIPRNSRPKVVRFGQDQSAQGEVKTQTLDHYDQVIVRGARRRSCFTVSYLDNTLEAGWTGTDEAAYEAGASSAPGYGALSRDEKRVRNAEVRAREKLKHVYRRFVLPEPWDGQAGDGLGGPKFAVFNGYYPTSGPGVAFGQVPHHELELFVEQTIPLVEGVDYSGDKIPDKTFAVPKGQEQNEAPPLVLWKKPDSGRYARIEKLADAAPTTHAKAEHNWSASVEAPREDRGILLTVSGAPQHVLDYLEFTKLPDDEELGEQNWRNMIVTLSVTDPRYAEVRWPHETDFSTGHQRTGDYARKLVIDAGDAYRLDYVASQTVVDVDAEGALVRSSGGFVRDDSLALQAIARVAYAYYGMERKTLYVSTEALTDVIWVGDMVVRVSSPDGDLVGTHFTPIRTPVTEVRIQTPWGTTEQPPDPPRQFFVTGAGQLDAVGLFAGPAPDPEPAKPARPFRDRAATRFDPTRGPYGEWTSDIDHSFWKNPQGKGLSD